MAEFLNDRIQVFSSTGTSHGYVGSPGSGPGELDAPAGVAVDARGRLYVADFYNQRVQLLSPEGKLRVQIGTTGAKGFRAGRFNYPTDVALLPDGGVVVADSYNDRVQVFEPDGELRHKWGGPMALNVPGGFNGWFRTAAGVAVDAEGNVFVADFFNHRVQKFTAEGRFLSSFGAHGRGPGELDRPTDVAVDEDGAVYVVDFGNDRIQEFMPAEPSNPPGSRAR